MAADLHIHTNFSDGSYSPLEIIEIAVAKNIDTISITDHDTVEGLETAINAGKKKGIEVIPGIELSTSYKKEDVHILGYYIDYKDDFLLAKINRFFEVRKKRARKMIKLLRKQGFDIQLERVKKIAGKNYIGRPHIARALIDAGYVENIKEAFTKKYIGNNARAYVPRYKISPEEAVSIIKKAKGIPVLAHPGFENPLTRKEIKDLKQKGLMGIEVFHSKHDQEATEYYKSLAEEMKLLIMGGSDFHGKNSPGVEMGDIRLENSYILQLKKAAGKVK